jgi:hypothetical protein
MADPVKVKLLFFRIIDHTVNAIDYCKNPDVQQVSAHLHQRSTVYKVRTQRRVSVQEVESLGVILQHYAGSLVFKK